MNTDMRGAVWQVLDGTWYAETGRPTTNRIPCAAIYAVTSQITGHDTHADAINAACKRLREATR